MDVPLCIEETGRDSSEILSKPSKIVDGKLSTLRVGLIANVAQDFDV